MAYKTIWYGIHYETNEVGSVWEDDKGSLSGGNNYTHQVQKGRNVATEISLVYKLGNLISEPAWLHANQRPGEKNQALEELEAKALKMREEAASKLKEDKGDE